MIVQHPRHNSLEEIGEEATEQEMPTSMSSAIDAEDGASEHEMEPAVRQRFPETWIWVDDLVKY